MKGKTKRNTSLKLRTELGEVSDLKSSKMNQFTGTKKSTFPMIRDEKEELFKRSNHSCDPSKAQNGEVNDHEWGVDPTHMKNLTEYLEYEDQNRNNLISTLNQNMKSIQRQLENPHNFRRFFWTPDYNIYGFAPKDEIS